MMFDFSFAELALAGFAAIVAVKPSDMPGFLRGCGEKWRGFRRWRMQWSSEMQAMLDTDAPVPKREMYVPDGETHAYERYVTDDIDAGAYDDSDEEAEYAAEHNAKAASSEDKIV